MEKDYDQLLYEELTKSDFDYSKVKELIKKGGNLNFTIDEDGTTVLMQAVEEHSNEMIKLYLQEGANIDVNTADEEGNTALMWEIYTAFDEIDIDIINMLIKSGADVNLKNKSGETPLDYAAMTDRGNSLKAIKILLENGADISNCKYNLHQINNKESEEFEEIKRFLTEKGVKPAPFTLRYQLKINCVECGIFNPINAPVQQINCYQCNSKININDNIWHIIFEYFDGEISTLSNKIDINKKRESPVCPNENCKEPININEITIGTNDSIICKKCGTEISNLQAPDWLKKFDENGATAKQIIAADSTDETISEATAIKCMSCGASMRILNDTPRLCTCEHCETQQYLPDDLWTKLHAVKKRKDWYILFEE